MSDIDTLQAQLAAAQAAYDQLMRGQQMAEIKHNNDTMRFSKGDIGQLAAYIADLKGQLQKLGVQIAGGRGRSRRIIF